MTAVAALLMLTCSFASFGLPSEALASALPEDESSGMVEQPEAVLEDWRSVGWDWTSLADEHGLVKVIVSYPESREAVRLAAEANPAQAALLSSLQLAGTVRYSRALDGFAGSISLELITELKASPDLGISIYPDLTVSAMLAESVVQVGATKIWSMRDGANQAVTGTGIVVAVIDTGVDYTHPDLGGGIGPSYKVIGGYDFVNDDNDPMDDNGHGTHCAGIVAANGGVKGVAPGASILALKALDSSGQGYMSDVIAAIDMAIDPNQDKDTADHVDVISMSLGGPGDVTDPVCLAVKNAVDAGVVVVAAAGNEGPALGTVAVPGLAPEAITVGAIDKSNELAQFSSRGTVPSLSIKPEISAPGVNIVSTVPFSGTSLSSPTGYYSASGTSMATPHVAGGAALLLQLHPTWSPAQVKSALVTGSYDLVASVWQAGAGGMWLPASADAIMFSSPALISYGIAGDPSQTVSISKSGPGASAQGSAVDWFSLLANGSLGTKVWTNVSSVSPSSFTIPSSGATSLTLQVAVPPPAAPEGYYEGFVRVTAGSLELKVPFGFAVLSRLSVSVKSVSGSEVRDPYGGVWVYRVPDCDIALGKRGSLSKPVPPLTLLLPSGTYNVHSIGHQLLYQFSDPYALSKTVTVSRLSSTEVSLSMADPEVRKFTLDLATSDGNPIYVKDFRVYFRYVGGKNVSFHVTGSDYSVKGDDVFSLPKTKAVYVSETDAKIGIAVSGFAYSPGMWDFMSRNWDHWYEYLSGTSTDFLVEASADLQYLMAWEFQGVSASTPTILNLVEGQYSTFTTKYDIPGAIGDLWCNWGTHRAQGGDAAFFTRRDTDTSLNPFFTGMTRTTVVQGVFSELYYPGNLFRGFIERSYYVPDYSRLLRANTAAEIYVPDRNFITSLPSETVVERIGVGPFYPSLTTYNTNNSLVIVQPLLRDQSGAKVGGMSMPTMDLYKNGQVVGMYQFPEYLARPDALRIINLSSSGQYAAKIKYTPFPQVSSSVTVTLSFSVPAADVNPPRIVSMVMPQVFVPGSSVPLSFQTVDDRSSAGLSVSWRPSPTSSWQALVVSSLGAGAYSTSVPTAVSDAAIHLLVRATDQAGNYMEFAMDNAALAQKPVTFSLASSTNEVGYRNGDAHVILTGQLRTLSESPLSSMGAVPLELFHNGRKVGMILDEYCAPSSHSHNGSIRFEWHFNPAEIFSGPNQTADIDVMFDLGIYQKVSQRITLKSVFWASRPPTITLVSPSNATLNAAGTAISLSITDDGLFTVQAYLDGVSMGALTPPWQIDTSSWSDGKHVLRIVATDDEGAISSASYEFEIDALIPSVEILYPSEGARIPKGSVLQALVHDTHLSQVTYRVDGGPSVQLAAPYSIDMSGWSEGWHNVEVSAVDAVGKVANRAVSFEIASSTVVVRVVSPADGSVVRSGVAIEVAVEGAEPTAVRWSEGGSWHDLGSARSIQTSGWSEGTHLIIINATDALNGYDQTSFTIRIDDTPPQLVLKSPQYGSFVTKEDIVRVSVADDNFAQVNWTLWGMRWRSANPELYISLASSPGDGYFTIEMAASDLAGNKASASFVFAMDTLEPSVSFVNLPSGCAIRPGTVIDALVHDAFLTSVQVSLDSATPSPLAPPYDIDTSALGSGPHSVEVVAADATGKTTTLVSTFYIDATSPQVAITTGTVFVAGQSHRVEAEASDDFGIDEVVLHCQLSGGGFSAVPMSWDGSRYVALLSSDMLWDGMAIYAVAVDKAGNSADSPQLVLAASLEPSGDDGGTGRTGTNEGTGFIVPSLWTEIAIVASAGTLVFVGVLFSRRRKEEDSPVGVTKPEPSRSFDGMEKLEHVARMEPKRAPPAAAMAAEERGIGVEVVMRKNENTRPARSAPVIRDEQKPQSVPLIDAIPDSGLAASGMRDAASDDIDYGELIERELVLPGRERSVFKGQENTPQKTDFELLREIMEDLGRPGFKKPLL